MMKFHYNLVQGHCLGNIILVAVLILQLLTGCAKRTDDKNEPTWERCVVQINYYGYAFSTEIYIFQPTGSLEIYSGYSTSPRVDPEKELSPETMPGWEREVSRMLTEEEQQSLFENIQAITPNGTLTEIPEPEQLEDLRYAVSDGTIEIMIWIDGQTVRFYDNAAIREYLEAYPQNEYAGFRKYLMSFLHKDYESAMEWIVDFLYHQRTSQSD